MTLVFPSSSSCVRRNPVPLMFDVSMAKLVLRLGLKGRKKRGETRISFSWVNSCSHSSSQVNATYADSSFRMLLVAVAVSGAQL